MASGFSGAQWEWPTGLNGRFPAASSSSDADRRNYDQYASDNIPTPDPQPAPEPAQERRRHYKPRTCRICLEVVQPTTEIDDSIAGGLFSLRVRVRYISEDPELGRLMSPCLCKGTQKYVHEGCLQAWRQAAPLSDRNYWRCPTCKFEYRLSRLRYGRWLSSKLLRGTMTVAILFITVFFLGFVADPIINLWVDPLGSIADTISDAIHDVEALNPLEDDELDTWWFHFVKGFLSLGVLGFLKTFLAMSPWHWLNVRAGVNRRRAAGRDRMEAISWSIVIIGVFTFLVATWKVVGHFCARALEKASDRVVDVQEDEDADDEEEDPTPDQESRKDR